MADCVDCRSVGDVIDVGVDLASFRRSIAKHADAGKQAPAWATEMLHRWERDWCRQHRRAPCRCCERRSAEWRVCERGLWICADCFPPPPAEGNSVEICGVNPCACCDSIEHSVRLAYLRSLRPEWHTNNNQ